MNHGIPSTAPAMKKPRRHLKKNDSGNTAASSSDFDLRPRWHEVTEAAEAAAQKEHDMLTGMSAVTESDDARLETDTHAADATTPLDATDVADGKAEDPSLGISAVTESDDARLGTGVHAADATAQQGATDVADGNVEDPSENLPL